MWSPGFSALSFMALATFTLCRPTRDLPYTNPILPGWHSDPSCTYVKEEDTVFCVTSTFIAFPGLPVYATKDLQNWKQVSNVFNRPSQIPSLSDTIGQQGGIYAPTLRYHDGTFYLIVSFLGPETKGLVFTSSDPYSDAAWSEPLEFPVRGIDPDIFWDDDGTVYVTSADDSRIQHYSLDLHTGATGPVTYLWNGTGGVWPEGPHLYRKDGFYYLMIAEGGTELNHAETMVRSKSRTGPWEPCPHNPILTNRNTTQYFQTVGHADLFQDGTGSWWAVALSTRSGPEWKNYPMGRETILAPATWEDGGWPVIQPVRGQMRAPLLPRENKHIKGHGSFVDEPDHVTFPPGSDIPSHFLYWRYPPTSSFAVSPQGAHASTLRLTPSLYNITGNASFTPDEGITLLTRRQTDTLFTYNVDVSFDPTVPNEEAGVTLFLTQEQHIDLGLVLLESQNGKYAPAFRLQVEGRGNYEGLLPGKIVPVPEAWRGAPIRFQIQAVSDTQYEFAVISTRKPSQKLVIGHADSRIVSGDTGRFTGTLVGVYATSNGGSGTADAYIRNWRYEGQGQKIA
ncbi:glycosyl hydrolase [Aspergillus bertholletiae]|uniref:Glycosyl hydrolase n=1 Tax=Aspergillus bertholletiae TaxID=1226010 RepID=A0A5N7BDS0_9EURO|nr:glycosyl hydrolase [Aspergillus bertholletiae]